MACSASFEMNTSLYVYGHYQIINTFTLQCGDPLFQKCLQNCLLTLLSIIYNIWEFHMDYVSCVTVGQKCLCFQFQQTHLAVGISNVRNEEATKDNTCSSLKLYR